MRLLEVPQFIKDKHCSKLFPGIPEANNLLILQSGFRILNKIRKLWGSLMLISQIQVNSDALVPGAHSLQFANIKVKSWIPKTTCDILGADLIDVFVF